MAGGGCVDEPEKHLWRIGGADESRGSNARHETVATMDVQLPMLQQRVTPLSRNGSEMTFDVDYPDPRTKEVPLTEEELAAIKNGTKRFYVFGRATYICFYYTPGDNPQHRFTQADRGNTTEDIASGQK